MDDDVSQPPTAPEKASVSADQNGSGTVSKKRRGVLSRIWNGIFSKRNEDFEKKLQHLSKEEASIHARMKRRAQRWRKTARNLMVFSVILEVAAVAYAIMSTRSFNLNWKMRAARVFPMFALPAFSSLIYSALVNFTRMCDRKDQKTLERLRTERQEKINELKERTNYYITQQLIQRYDPDPAAKAAAASVLASKLGAESGLKVHLGDESYLNAPIGKSSDIEWVQSRGLRNRKPLSKTSSTASSELQQLVEEMPHDNVHDSLDSSAQNQAVFVEHHPRSATNEGGWIARVAALLVGEDPTQCYALICGNCHMHNGLARKEDFAYITYYCPHCNALNGSRQQEEPGSVSNSKPSSPASVTSDANSNASISGATSNSAAAAMGTSVKKDDLKELNPPAS